MILRVRLTQTRVSAKIFLNPMERYPLHLIPNAWRLAKQIHITVLSITFYIPQACVKSLCYIFSNSWWSYPAIMPQFLVTC